MYPVRLKDKIAEIGLPILQILAILYDGMNASLPVEHHIKHVIRE